VLLWLNIIAERGQSVAEIMSEHWQAYGRDYYSRHDYEGVPPDVASALIDGLRDCLSDFPGHSFQGLKVSEANEFSYHDPVDGSVSNNQGLRIIFEGGGRAVLRLSGTGTEGATLRIYLEQYAPQDADHSLNAQKALNGVRTAVAELCQLEAILGRVAPDVLT
jgi:phosphoglucomutase